MPVAGPDARAYSIDLRIVAEADIISAQLGVVVLSRCRSYARNEKEVQRVLHVNGRVRVAV